MLNLVTASKLVLHRLHADVYDIYPHDRVQYIQPGRSCGGFLWCCRSLIVEVAHRYPSRCMYGILLVAAGSEDLAIDDKPRRVYMLILQQSFSLQAEFS